MVIRPVVPAAILCGLVVGCATEGPRPSDELVRAQTLVQQADKSGAQRYAAADLQRAHDELSNAQRADGEKKYDDARRYAESAVADANVATARAASGAAEQSAQQITRSNELLRQEAERGTPLTTSPPNDSGAGQGPTPDQTSSPNQTSSPHSSPNFTRAPNNGPGTN